jgi:nucleoside 2-deoxyribosyltransferase
MNHSYKVYVGCALTHVPDVEKTNFLSLVDQIKAILKNQGFQVLDFLSAIEKDPIPSKVYEFDISALKDCDCVLAIGDYPGTGLGYEICYATEIRNVPVMVGVRDTNNLSKLLRGVSKDNYVTKVFSNHSDLVSDFKMFVNKYYEKNK